MHEYQSKMDVCAAYDETVQSRLVEILHHAPASRVPAFVSLFIGFTVGAIALQTALNRH